VVDSSLSNRMGLEIYNSRGLGVWYFNSHLLNWILLELRTGVIHGEYMIALVAHLIKNGT
jgi:hypothetical protein